MLVVIFMKNKILKYFAWQNWIFSSWL